MHKQQTYLFELHKEILSIMDSVDKICRKENLRYYLIGGSLLGAVRHKGFIPWDDDLDIVMPREDVEKFIELTENELPESLYLRWITTEKTYGQIVAKICKTNTVFDEYGNAYGKRNGIFIDIFPLDLCEGYSSRLDKFRLYLNQLRVCLYLKSQGCNFNLNQFPYYIVNLFLSEKKLHKLIMSLIKKQKKYGQTHYAMFGSGYALKKQTFPIEWFGEGVEISFENRTYLCPSNSKSVLTLTFGKDYMQEPPKEKQVTHNPIYVRFSNGNEINFVTE